MPCAAQFTPAAIVLPCPCHAFTYPAAYPRNSPQNDSPRAIHPRAIWRPCCSCCHHPASHHPASRPRQIITPPEQPAASHARIKPRPRNASPAPPADPAPCTLLRSFISPRECVRPFYPGFVFAPRAGLSQMMPRGAKCIRGAIRTVISRGKP